MAKPNTKTVFMLASVAGMLTATAQAQTLVERGRYLVEGILTCGNCHSPRGPGGVIDTAKLYSGGPQTWDEPTFTVKGSNITPDPYTGIGRWSEAAIVRTSASVIGFSHSNVIDWLCARSTGTRMQVTPIAILSSSKIFRASRMTFVSSSL